jgi:hypothetical protein
LWTIFSEFECKTEEIIYFMSTIPEPIAGGGGVPGSPQQTFNTAYYNHWPPIKQPLFNSRPHAQNEALPQLSVADRLACVQACLNAGVLIDEEIDYSPDTDPYTVMYMRSVVYGQKWEPAGTGNVISQEVEIPGAYSGPRPPGTLLVSTDPADFPPYPKPVVPVVTPTGNKAVNPVGIRIIQESPAQANYVGDVFRCAVANDGFGVTETWDGTSGAFHGEWTKSALLAGMMIVWVKSK